jgi:hypothetical protein
MKRMLLVALLVGVFGSVTWADVLILDVTKESQAKDRIDWFAISVTDHVATPTVLLFTVTLRKDATPSYAQNATLHYRNPKNQLIVSAPIRIDKRKDGTGSATIAIDRDAVEGCILQFDSYKQIVEDGPEIIDECRVKLSTYVEKEKK